MKAQLFVLPAALLPLLVSAGVGPEKPSPGEALKQWAEDLKSSDVAKMLIHYEDSKDVFAIESTGRTRKGAADIRKMYEEAFEEVVKAFKISVTPFARPIAPV